MGNLLCRKLSYIFAYCDDIIWFQPFPVSVHKGWKLNSFRHNSRVWCQEIEADCKSASVNVFASYVKIRVPAQVCFFLFCCEVVTRDIFMIDITQSITFIDFMI